MRHLARQRYRGFGRSTLGMALAVAAIFSGCMPHKLYNARPDQYLQRLATDAGDSAAADLAIIEFDDHGVFWKRDQLEDTVSLIRRANEEASEGTLVLVYIHGWKNNADPNHENGSLERFRQTVLANATRDRDDRPFATDRVVGVFLGWRGDSSNMPLQEQLTFWDRRQAGERVASIHMQETLLRIMQATKERAGSKCFIVGHSMGGMIIGKAISPSLTTLLLAEGRDGVRLPVDLVILQNPALEALATWQFIDILKRFQARLDLRSDDGSVQPADGPLIASITSVADSATGRAYPFGRTIASFGTKFRRDMGPGMPSQHHLATRAVGHVDYLTSHRAYLRDGEIILERIPGAFNDTPFWVIEVSKDISKDHGDVGNPTYGRLIEKLIQLNQVYRTDLESIMTITDPQEQ